MTISLQNAVRTMALVGIFLLGLGCDTQESFSSAPTETGSQLPHLSQHPAGGVILSWVEPRENGHRLQYARYNEGAWSIASTAASGEDWFVNWADFPSVEAITEKFLVAHWLVRSGWQSYAYDVALSMSTDGGRTWSDRVTPHKDNTPTEHGFVSLYAQGEELGLVWLDGRKTMASAAGGVAPEDMGMTLRSAKLDQDGNVTEASLIDALVCDCCQTDVTLNADGPVVVYRDRSVDEIRDISVARYRNGKWTEGQLVAEDNWQVYGCPVNGPAIDAAGDIVAVAWHTEAEGQPTVQFARTFSPSDNFDSPIEIDNTRALGRVDVLVDEHGDAYVSWLRKGEHNNAELCIRSVDRAGNMGPVSVIAEIPAIRPSGFPQMAQVENQILLAWTVMHDGEFQIATELRPWSIPPL